MSTNEQMVVYMTDCTLATVDKLAMLKSRPKGEYQRQKNIAQKGVDWIKNNNINAEGSRPLEVIEKFNGNVEEYSQHIEGSL